MVKFSTELKEKVVVHYLGGKRSARSIAQEHGMDESMVRLWVRQYKQYGIAGLAGRRRNYEVEFKLCVVKHVWENQASYSDAAMLFDIRRPGCIREWEKRYRSGGIEALTLKGRMSSTMKPPKPKTLPPVMKEDESRSREDLIKELNYLRMENVYLKKLKALVQEQAQARHKKRK
jgi:transposase